MAMQAAATPAQAVADSALTAQEHDADPAPGHHHDISMGPAAAAEATTSMPAPGGIESATAVAPAQEY